MKQPIVSARLMAAQIEEERERGELIEGIARRIVERRLETPAVLFLELHKPLAFLAGQAALAAVPFLGLFFAPEEIERAVRLLGSPEAVDQLIARIEQIVAARPAGAQDGMGRPSHLPHLGATAEGCPPDAPEGRSEIKHDPD